MHSDSQTSEDYVKGLLGLPEKTVHSFIHSSWYSRNTPGQPLQTWNEEAPGRSQILMPTAPRLPPSRQSVPLH